MPIIGEWKFRVNLIRSACVDNLRGGEVARHGTSKEDSYLSFILKSNNRDLFWSFFLSCVITYRHNVNIVWSKLMIRSSGIRFSVTISLIFDKNNSFCSGKFSSNFRAAFVPLRWTKFNRLRNDWAQELFKSIDPPNSTRCWRFLALIIPRAAAITFYWQYLPKVEDFLCSR